MLGGRRGSLGAGATTSKVGDALLAPILDPEDPSSPAPTSLTVQPPDEITQGAQTASSTDADRVATPLLHRILVFWIHKWERALIIVLLLVFIILISVKGVSVFGDILSWFQKQNNFVGWFSFTVLYCLNISLFLPGIVLVLGAGFVFGFWKGLLAVWLGGGIGQSFAFLLARYLLQDWVAALFKGKSRQWDTINRAMELEGWKLLVLLRLSPLVPYNLLNIAMAATKIHFWAFAVTSFFGIIPECALFCYMGSLAENMTQVLNGRGKPRGKTTWIVTGVMALVVVITVTWATLFIRRVLKRADEHLRENEMGESAGGDAGNSILQTHVNAAAKVT
eukprot:jgi/Botrbrau1/12505/Bobra.0169s0048.5